MEFYRYESCDRGYEGAFGLYIPGPKIKLRTFYFVKETKCGYWITDSQIPTELFDFNLCWKKWVSKTSVKRFAYPSKEKAFKSFECRTKRRISILAGNLKFCKALLIMINKKIKE